MPFGYNGKILHVNLTTGRCTVEEPSEAFYRKYMGGSALNLYYILNEMPAGVDPLGPENVLAISAGVVTSVPISGQSRVTVSAKSPLTGAIGDSQSGGFWPAELKFAGFDAIIIKGVSSKPVWLWVCDGKAEIRDASHLWGMETGDCEAAIRHEMGDEKIKVMQIGPAGENGVRFANILNMCNRANGRTGMGAVMGSKRLRAVAVRGKKRPEIADKAGFKALAAKGGKAFPESMVAGLGKYGTSVAVAGQNAAGGLPTRNFTSGVFEGAEKINGKVLYETLLKGRKTGNQDKEGRDTCYGCVVRCKRVAELTDGPYPLDPVYGGPEYETIATFGSYCGVDDLNIIAKASEYCNRYGIDTISCGATIAWAMEMFEAGQLTADETGGPRLNFGNGEAMLSLVQKIARREGFGDLLAEGSARAADRLGRGHEFLITSKGQEAPAHMPHLKRSLSLIYAANPFGADHQSSDHDPDYEFGGYEYFQERLSPLGFREPQEPLSLTDEKVRFAARTQHLYSLLDSLNLCQFVHGPTWQLYGPADIVQLVRTVTGWNVDMDELLTVGERRLSMMRAFNAREGLTREQDRLPEKFFKTALKGGPTDGFKIDGDEFEAALNRYYHHMGWDETTGNPTRETLERLGLGWVSREGGSAQKSASE